MRIHHYSFEMSPNGTNWYPIHIATLQTLSPEEIKCKEDEKPVEYFFNYGPGLTNSIELSAKQRVTIDNTVMLTRESDYAFTGIKVEISANPSAYPTKVIVMERQ